MKHFHRFAILAALLLAACAGTALRKNFQLPSLANAWKPIRVEVLREGGVVQHPAAAATVAAADEALAAADPIAIATVDWSTIDELSAADTNRREAAGLIGPGVAKFLRDRLTDFKETRALYLRTNR